jgi:hypothetical protein
MRLLFTAGRVAEIRGQRSGADKIEMPGKVKNRVLFQSRRLSIYLVRYRAGHAIVPHVDMVSEGRLYKLNFVLVKPAEGGEFSCEKNILNLFGRIILFRPDLHRHSVSRIERGCRWLLSFALTRT